MKNKKRGFTLVELMVVIAIITFLASIVVSALNASRSKARDAERKQDMIQVRNALELYYSVNKSYPSTGGNFYSTSVNVPGPGTCSDFNGSGTYTRTGANGYIPNLAPTYISILPIDPRPLSTGNCYLYRSDGVNYKFLVFGTVENFSSNDPINDPGNRANSWAYCTDTVSCTTW